MWGDSVTNEKNVIIKDIDLGAEDEDEEALEPAPTTYKLTQSVMIGLAMALLIVIESFPVRLMVVQAKALGAVSYKNSAIIVTVPIFAWFTLFFAVVAIGMIFQLLGPVTEITQGNSHFYSSRAPNRKRHPNIEWPHITIQMPVYKEGLKGVIIPTLNSVLAAIRHYENLGGTASVFVCVRMFYAANSIGWCARPAHGKDGFERKGEFKKASNMNYCLSFSSRVEDEMLRLLKQKAQTENREQESFSIQEEEEVYNQALQNMLDKDAGKSWAAGNVRMGEIILIIDCDTRVPVDCLSLGAMEMKESPEVAIIQHASGIMQVIHTIFENAITYFTNLVYTLISFSVGSGDCAPFVGHNAFLRWKAIQSVSFMEGDELKFWSEDHVSEDFDMSLRLQTAGFIVRLATYDHGEFKEGVSLTASDELLRWEKYAYGCSELVFNPVYQWLWKGPFTKLFIRFLGPNMKISAKMTILGYIGTYYAIAAALPLCIINYLLFGWVGGENLDHSYLPSWDILCGTLFIFMIASPVCFAWFRHKIGPKMFVWAVLESFMWMPFFLIFFGGLSWHISYALLAHMFGLPIGWSSTAKEVEATGLIVGIGAIFKQFRFVLLAMCVLTAGVIYLAVGAPPGWEITAWPSILPLALQIVGHVGLPAFTIIDSGVHVSWSRKG
ncbi:glycosyltransferase family 2 protein [Seiridium cupressi]